MQDSLNLVPSNIESVITREQDIGFAKGLMKAPQMVRAEQLQIDQDIDELTKPTSESTADENT